VSDGLRNHTGEECGYSCLNRLFPWVVCGGAELLVLVLIW
jgi:hypothetical protein